MNDIILFKDLSLTTILMILVTCFWTFTWRFRPECATSQSV